jgi:hypothetical protein
MKDIYSEYNKSPMLDKYILYCPCPAFTFTFACVAPFHVRQYLHKLKAFFVRGVPSLFSAMLHPCNLALHEVKVSTA